MRCRYYRRKDTRQERYVVYLDWEGKRWARTNYDNYLPIHTKDMAERLCHSINREIDSLKTSTGTYFNPNKWFHRDQKFKQYAPTWLKGRKDIQEPTREIYQRVIDEACAVFGHVNIGNINKKHLREYQNSLPKNLSNNSVIHRLGILHILFSYAYNEEDILRIPGFPKDIKATRKKTVGLTVEEQLRIMAEIPAHDKPIFRFMMAYGVRVSEAIALMWDAVLWDRGEIVIKRTMSGVRVRESRKAGDRLPLPMSAEIRAMLTTIRGIGGPVFRNRKGNRYQRQALLVTLQAACRRARVRKVTLHQFARHSKGYQLRNRKNPVPLDLIAALFGQSSTQHTERYAELETETLKELVE